MDTFYGEFFYMGLNLSSAINSAVKWQTSRFNFFLFLICWPFHFRVMRDFKWTKLCIIFRIFLTYQTTLLLDRLYRSGTWQKWTQKLFRPAAFFDLIFLFIYIFCQFFKIITTWQEPTTVITLAWYLCYHQEIKVFKNIFFSWSLSQTAHFELAIYMFNGTL